MSAASAAIREYQDFAASTHGRTTFDAQHFEFSPYRLRSEVKREEIRKEHVLKKSVDLALFHLNRWSGIQQFTDLYMSMHDEDALQKLTYSSRSRTDLYRQMNAKAKDFNGTEIGIRAAVSVILVLGGTLLSTQWVYQSLRRGYEEDVVGAIGGFRRRAHAHPRVKNALLRHLSHPTDLTSASNIASECPFCLNKVEANSPFRLLHCRGEHGQLPENITPVHSYCFKKWQKSRGGSLSEFLDTPCITCKEPMISESLFQETLRREAPELVRPEPKTFPQYVLDKFRLPLSKARGYAPLPMQDHGIELPHLHDE
jgi:hypothetical protein